MSFHSITFPTTNKEDPVSDLRPSMCATVSEEMEPQTNSNTSDKSMWVDNYIKVSA
jgi:hypothetical protein